MTAPHTSTPDAAPTAAPDAAHGFRPTDEAQLAELITWAVSEKRPLDLRGHGTKAALGRPVNTESAVDLTGFSGISFYEPAELVMTAGAGTPMAEIQETLAAKNQNLAFEPMDMSVLLGTEGTGTLGGCLACNLAGPRRISQGAARDHFLGFRAVSGRGEIFKSGARVVKNVTGFDLPKVFAGSYGTLAAMTEITVKVLPAPETVRTVVIGGESTDAAARIMSAALGGPHEVTGAAHLPVMPGGGAVGVASIDGRAQGVTLLRVEGPEPSAVYRSDALKAELAGGAAFAEILGDGDSRTLWAAVRDVRCLAGLPSEMLIWKVSVAPMSGPAVVADFVHSGLDPASVQAQYDWGGGLVWLAVNPADPVIAAAGDGGAAALRGAVAAVGGGHATLVRAPSAMRASVPVFQPQPSALALASTRLKQGYDPTGILCPGRMAAS